MTLRLGEDAEVMAVSLPERLCGVPERIALISADRKAGLLLRSVSSPVLTSPGRGIEIRRRRSGRLVA